MNGSRDPNAIAAFAIAITLSGCGFADEAEDIARTNLVCNQASNNSTPFDEASKDACTCEIKALRQANLTSKDAVGPRSVEYVKIVSACEKKSGLTEIRRQRAWEDDQGRIDVASDFEAEAELRRLTDELDADSAY